jgi:RNA polymerase sigma-70 factor (ECF subfamily)
VPENSYHEKEILIKIAEGDQKAFGLLFQHYKAGIYTIAFRLTHSAAVSEEIVQDVFLKVWVKRSGLDQIENFRAYLFTIAQNTIYSAMRKLCKQKLLSQDPATIVTLATPEEDTKNRDYEQLLQEAVERLPAKQKRTYVLIKKEGLKREQAAVILHVSAETVKSNLEQAIRNIKAYCLAKDLHLTADGTTARAGGP